MNRFVSTSPGDSKDGAGDGEGFAVSNWPSAVVATAISRMRRCVFIVQGLCQEGISWLFFGDRLTVPQNFAYETFVSRLISLLWQRRPTSGVGFGISVENLLKMKDRTLADADEAFVRTIQVEHDKDRRAKKKGHDDPSGQTTIIPQPAGEADCRDAGNATEQEQPNHGIRHAALPREHSITMDR